jgi:methionine sulfoxide reductase heme-binding subunit
MSGLTASAALWYASRATGVVSLLLLSAVVVLGVLVNGQGHLPGLPRFAVTGLHRNLALLGVVFVVVHIVTAVFDSYVSIRLVAAIIPFTSSYEPFWLGLGAVAVDLLVAVIVTSLLRARIAPGLWRAVHWLAYAIYPVVVVHSIGSSRDLQGGWLLMLTVGCVAACVVAVGFRLVRARARVPRARRVGVRLGAVVGRGAQR